MTTEKSILWHKLKEFISLAVDRVESEPKNIENTISDILNEFPKIKEPEFRKALRNGGLGKYGVTYKLTTQVICYWIREYKKENLNKLGL